MQELLGEMSRKSEVQVEEESDNDEEQPCPTHKELLAAAQVLERAFGKEGNRHLVHRINTEVQKIVLKSVKQVMTRRYFVGKENWIKTICPLHFKRASCQYIHVLYHHCMTLEINLVKVIPCKDFPDTR